MAPISGVCPEKILDDRRIFFSDLIIIYVSSYWFESIALKYGLD